jgi:hypothetical protein
MSGKKKPRIYHQIQTGVNEKKEFPKDVKLVVKSADSVFNSPSRAKSKFNKLRKNK